MLNSRGRIALWLAATTAVLLLVAWVAMPRIISQLPGRVRQYLPSELTAQTPIPLPTPQVPAQAITIVPPTVSAGQSRPAVPATVEATQPAVALAADTTPQATETLTATTLLSSPATPSVQSYPPSVYIEGVAIIPQKFNNCGATNLAMILNYHGVPADQFAIADVVRPNYEDRNVSPEELAEYVSEETDLEAAVVPGANIDTLKRLIAAGLPVIIEKGLVPDDEIGWMGHYLTLYGYDDADNSFYVRDSFLGPWEEDGRESYNDVLEYWRMFNNVVIVTYPPELSPEVAAIVGDSLDDPAAAWGMAAENARLSIRGDGEDPFAWFNLGTALTRLYALSAEPDQLHQAVASFDRARHLGLPPRMLWYQFTPYEAYLAAGRTEDVMALADATMSNQGGRSVEETYIYRALALRAKGDEPGAQADLQRAEALHPGNPLLQRVLATQQP